MNLRAAKRAVEGAGARRGFTMIEIAICIAVIGFALVAIIGVLPKGMLTQRDNRTDTIIGQDGMYWMEAIRSGARGLDDLTNYVDEIQVNGQPQAFVNGYDIIGLLSTPEAEVKARVRAMSGSAVEHATVTRDIAFKYEMEVYNAASKWARPPGARVSDLILTFRWPVTRTGVGGRSRVFRAQVNGIITMDDPPGSQRFFFKP